MGDVGWRGASSLNQCKSSWTRQSKEKGAAVRVRPVRGERWRQA